MIERAKELWWWRWQWLVRMADKDGEREKKSDNLERGKKKFGEILGGKNKRRQIYFEDEDNFN